MGDLVMEEGLKADPETFFRRFYPLLFRSISESSGASRAEVEDLVQDVLLHAWKGRQQFRGETSPLRWMLAIARHKILDRFRNRDRDRRADVILRALGELDRTAIPAELLESAELRRQVRRALAGLPPHYVDVLRRRYVEGQTVRGIAAASGESEKSIESRLERARVGFKASMAAREEPHDDAE
jgi:RNA polymerase sigma-70 factor (ECF subfamily)